MQAFDKMLSFMLKPWVMVVSLGIVMLSYTYVDKDLALYMYSFKLRENLPILNWITFLGKPEIYLVILPVFAIICAYIFRRKTWAMKAWMLWLFVLYPSLIAFVLKSVFGRARPIVFFDNQDFGFFGWHMSRDYRSFPSGHTTTMAGLMVGLLILFPRYRYLFLPLGILVIASRILLTYHFMSDVLASFYLVVLELGLLLYIMRRKFPKICGLVIK
jgi:membrane-associated phospholipid phosphatase